MRVKLRGSVSVGSISVCRILITLTSDCSCYTELKTLVAYKTATCDCTITLHGRFFSNKSEQHIAKRSRETKLYETDLQVQFVLN